MTGIFAFASKTRISNSNPSPKGTVRPKHKSRTGNRKKRRQASGSKENALAGGDSRMLTGSEQGTNGYQ